MALPVTSVLDFGNAQRITNLAPATAAGQAVVFEQLNSAVEGLAWKDDVRVATTVNLNLASPGAAIDGVTMANGDRVLVKDQTTASENGIYIWNGAAVPMTRSSDADTFTELEGAVVTATEGTTATYRQTQVNGTLGTNDVVWVSFNSGAPAASETTAGIAEIATQAETNTGTDDTRFITPAKLAAWSGRPLRYAATIGDASNTSFAITHNLGTRDVVVHVYENGGSYREVIVEVQHTSTTQITVIFDVAPASNAYRVVVIA